MSEIDDIIKESAECTAGHMAYYPPTFSEVHRMAAEFGRLRGLRALAPKVPVKLHGIDQYGKPVSETVEVPEDLADKITKAKLDHCPACGKVLEGGEDSCPECKSKFVKGEGGKVTGIDLENGE